MTFGLRSFIFTNRQLLKTKVKEPISKVSIKNSRLLIRFVSISETLCFSKGNTLFHQRKHFVASRETLCFTKGNTFGNVFANLASLSTYLANLHVSFSRKDAKHAKEAPRISCIDTYIFNLTTDYGQQTTDCLSEERKDSCKFA